MKTSEIQKPTTLPPLCACGCGKPVNWSDSFNHWCKYLAGHYNQTVYKKRGEPPFCACGCGNPVKWNTARGTWCKYLVGHQLIVTVRKRGEPPFCACGCGNPVSWNNTMGKWSTYVRDHCMRMHRKVLEKPPLCACGCGSPVEWNKTSTKWCQYYKNHQVLMNFTKNKRVFKSWATNRSIPVDVQNLILKNQSFVFKDNPIGIPKPVKKTPKLDQSPRFVSVYKNVTRGMFYSP